MIGSFDFTVNQIANRNQTNLFKNGQRLEAIVIFLGLKV